MIAHFDLIMTVISIWLCFLTQQHARTLRGVLGLIGLALLVALRVMMIGLPFYALLFFLIYLGAVLVIFLFVIMTIDQKSDLVAEKRYFGLDFRKFIFALSMTGLALGSHFYKNGYLMSMSVRNLGSQEIAQELAIASSALLIPLGLYLLVVMVTAISLFKTQKRDLL